ncbi:MAG: zf-HC2 domain-containing protein [Candidatus Wallbacteria bacterium]|nr:zf-HC2 domain-containing protein [Candidatus Wallbacteria bacterium]
MQGPTGPECAKMRELLSARVDGELAGGEAGLLDAHLASCAGCRTEQETFAAVELELRRSLEPSAEELAASRSRVLSRLATLDGAALAPSWWDGLLAFTWRPALALGMAVALVAVVSRAPEVVEAPGRQSAAVEPGDGATALVLARLPSSSLAEGIGVDAGPGSVALRLDSGASGETPILWVITGGEQ